MGQVQSTERERIADESELTKDELKAASGGDNINHEVHAQGTATARVAPAAFEGRY